MAGAENGAALIWCPFPDRASARAVAAQMLDHGHIACANIIGELESVFMWQGARETATETGVLFKTTAARLTDAVAQLGKLHPYDTPAIVGWHCDAAHPATNAWLATALSGPAEGAQARD